VNVGYSCHEKIKKKRINEMVKIIWKSMKWKTGKKRIKSEIGSLRTSIKISNFHSS
jgi:hypothetical protein